MTGGKESRVYGIEVKTGKIRYECTMAGCFSPSGEALSSQETDLEDIVIVKRETQVVRAIEPRTGSEKWNFSVSTHHLTFRYNCFQFFKIVKNDLFFIRIITYVFKTRL